MRGGAGPGVAAAAGGVHNTSYLNKAFSDSFLLVASILTPRLTFTESPVSSR